MAARVKLSEEQYWGSASVLDREVTRRLEEDELGTAIFAPPRVTVPGADSLPVLGVRVVTLREATLQRGFRDSAIAIASNLDTGRVYVGSAFPEPTELEPRDEPEDPGPGITGETFRLDLAARLEIPMKPATLTAWLVVRATKTEPAKIRLVPPPSQHQDPEVAKFVEGWRKEHAPAPAPVSPAVTPGTRFPTYERVDTSPAVPKENGVALAIKRVIVLDKEDGCVLSGAFRLPLRPRHVVKNDPSGITAILPITLVLAAEDLSGPRVFELRVPTKTPIDPNVDMQPVEGTFALDLFMFESMWQVPRTFHVWAASGDTLSGPASCTMLTTEMMADDV